MADPADVAHWRGNSGNPVGAAAAFKQLLTDRLRSLGQVVQRTEIRHLIYKHYPNGVRGDMEMRWRLSVGD